MHLKTNRTSSFEKFILLWWDKERGKLELSILNQALCKEFSLAVPLPVHAATVHQPV